MYNQPVVHPVVQPVVQLVASCIRTVRGGDSSLCFVYTLETRLDAFETKGLRKILRVSWTAKKTNEWVLKKAGVKRELLDAVKATKLNKGVAWRKR